MRRNTPASMLFSVVAEMKKVSTIPCFKVYRHCFRVLLVATGLWVPQTADFAGSELVEGYESISVNPADYKDQAVLILGKGNAAFETAQSLLGWAGRVHMLSNNPVRLAWQTHYVGDLR